MNVDNELAKASEIMWRYRMSKDDQIAVIKLLVDAGVERCLQEQQRLREEQEDMIAKAQSTPKRYMN